MRILAAGGINLDVLGQPAADLKLRDSNPGSVRFRAGGVCHNIALELSRRGHTVQMLTCLGRDPAADLLESLCREEGIGLTFSLRTDAPTGVYLCMHERSGEVLCAVNDMKAMDALDPGSALERLDEMPPADLMVLDCNLREDTLCALAEKAAGKMPLFLDPVSTFKAGRCRRILPLLTAIKPNRMEAETLTGCTDTADSAMALIGMGVSRVFISLGAEGVYYADGTCGGLCPAVPLKNGTPLTGAGDALCGGIIQALLEEKDTAGCAAAGVLSAGQKLRGA